MDKGLELNQTIPKALTGKINGGIKAIMIPLKS